MDEDIIELSKSCATLFPNSYFGFKKDKETYTFIISGNRMSSAQIIRSNRSMSVQVLHWFENFWIYGEINKIPKDNPKEYPQIFISLSIFEGTESDSTKTHLFRAEWDTHDDNTIHPQPHWHIHPYQHAHNIQDDFETFNKITQEQDKQEQGFDAAISEQNKIIDLKRIHFAMNARWADNFGHIHPISNKKELISWMYGLLSHIKGQIESVSAKE